MRRIDAKDLGFINELIAEDPALQAAMTEALDRKLARMRLMFVDAPPAHEIVNQNGTGHEMIPEGQPLPSFGPPVLGTPMLDIPSDLSREEREIVQWFAVRGGAYPANMHARRSCEAQVNVQAKAFDQAWRNVKTRGLIIGEGSGPGARFRFYKA